MDGFFAENGTGRAVFFLKDLDGATLQEFQDLTSQIAHETGIQLQPVGTAFVMKEMNDQIIPQQLASLGLAIGFTAMLLSPLQIHVTLSILMWVTMITSAVLSLTFLPTITGGGRRLSPPGGQP